MYVCIHLIFPLELRYLGAPPIMQPIMASQPKPGAQLYQNNLGIWLKMKSPQPQPCPYQVRIPGVGTCEPASLSRFPSETRVE